MTLFIYNVSIQQEAGCTANGHCTCYYIGAMSTHTFRTLFAGAALFAIASALSAETVFIMTDGGGGEFYYAGSEREAHLVSATGGYAVGDVTGTPGAADVAARFGGTWTNEGAVAGADGTNDMLTIALAPGNTWGNGPLSGTWAINPLFWSTYGDAVITMHVGNGSGDPDWFFWKITALETSGKFTYERISGGGGGLSNLFLWGSGTPQKRVPDGGLTLVMLAVSMCGTLAARRWIR